MIFYHIFARNSIFFNIYVLTFYFTHDIFKIGFYVFIILRRKTMRKKLLFLALFALILCLFVISASAFEVDGLYYSINSDGKTVTLNSENREKGTLVNVVIPETVQYDNNNDGINETYVVTTIGEASFGHKDYAVNSPVETVFIPKTVSTINSHAFRNLQNLKSLVVEASGYDSETGLTKEVKLYNAEFLGCSNLVTVDLSKSNITQIGSYAFRDCTSLKEVKLPESIQALGGECFKNCPSLEKINLPRTITSIGGSSFWGNTKMTGDYIFDYLSSLGNHAFRETSITSIVILDGAFTSPGSDAAFYNCKNLQYVVLPDSVESFASNTFTSCSSLKFVSFCDARIPATQPMALPRNEKNTFQSIRFSSHILNAAKPIPCRFQVCPMRLPHRFL